MKAKQIIDEALASFPSAVFDFTAAIMDNHSADANPVLVLDDIQGMLGMGAPAEVVAWYAARGIEA